MKLELPSAGNRHDSSPSNNWIPEDRPIIGLDFGTTNTVLASFIHDFNHKGPRTITFAQTGSELYPSFALYNQVAGTFLTGPAAYKRRFMEPEKVIRSVKRHLDKEFLLLSDEKVRPSDVVQAICHDALKQLHDLNPQSVPQTVVATVPYHFLQNQNIIIRNAVKSACTKIFGKSPEIFVLPEPMAAALYWIYLRNEEFKDGDVRTLIFDLGGGTFDLSHLRLSVKKDRIDSEIVATTGDSSIGGDDIDQVILNHIFDVCSIDLSALPERMQLKVKANLLDAVIEAKHELTFKNETSIVYKFGDVDVDIVLQRETFEQLLKGGVGTQLSFMDRIEATVAKIAERESVRQKGFDYVILVGGPTKMPVIRDYVKRRFPKARILIQDDSNDHTCVALGASVYATMLTTGADSPFGQRMTLNQFRSRTPYNYYIRKYDGSLDIIVKSGQLCPVTTRRTYNPTHLKDNNRLVDLSTIKIFQGPHQSSAVYIGSIDMAKEKIFAHGRKASEIPVTVELTADSTFLNAKINVANGNADKSPFLKQVTIQI